jgi:hypothetical protein
MGWGSILGDFIGGTGRLVSQAAGRDVQLWPGGAGAALTGYATPNMADNQKYGQNAYRIMNPNPSPAPQTGGGTPPPSGGPKPVVQTTGNNGTGPGAGTGTNPPGGGGPSQFDILRATFDNNRNALQGLIPGIDQTYNTAKGDIENAVTNAETAANTQKDALGTQFGGILRNQAKTYNDLGRQGMGMYSGLGSLDSSSYADYQNKNEQQLKEGQLQTQLEQSKQTKSVDDQFNNYKQQALSALQSYGTQYQQAKNGISQAMAQGNINEASALAQAAQEAQNQYNSIQDNMRNWASQSAILKAQGIDVSGALAGINGDQYAQNAQNQLTQASNYGASLMPKMNQMLAFIGDDKKNRNPYQQYA